MAEGDVTQILLRIGEGESRAADVLLPIVYDQLHALAASYLRHERPGHTLQTTALVHEAYIKLVDQTQAQYLNRAHFYAIAAQAMRRILVNYARDAKRLKRGGGHHRLDLADPPPASTTARSISTLSTSACNASPPWTTARPVPSKCDSSAA